MTDHPDSGDRTRFSQDEVERILERAIELDTVRGAEVTESELREVGDALGLSSEVMTRAIQEGRRPPEVSLSLVQSRRPSGLEALVLAAIGSAAVLPVALPLGVIPALVSIGGLFGLSLALGLDSRRSNAMRRYWVRTSSLWAGFIVAGATLTSNGGLLAIGALTLIPMLLGAGLLVVGRWIAHHDVSFTPPAPPTGRGPLSALVHRFKWIRDQVRGHWSQFSGLLSRTFVGRNKKEVSDSVGEPRLA